MLVTLERGTFDEWRAHARSLLASGQAPAEVTWRDRDRPSSLFDASEPASTPGMAGVAVPRPFVRLAESVACHRDPARWDLLYRLLWRLTHERRTLLGDPLDEDVSRGEAMRRQVSHDVHRMHAFVRFRRVSEGDGERYVAWYSPQHRILRLAVPFFVERFRSMRWSVLTPEESAHWDGTSLTFSAGAPLSAAPAEDALETVWRAYYESVFNPARMNLPLMRSHVPLRFWTALPETRAIPTLAASAHDAVGGMMRHTTAVHSARPFVPATNDLETLRSAVPGCTGCPLHTGPTRAVFGEGPRDARIVLVGEQPGDEEDRAGPPFVGPAGQLLDDALKRAGIARDLVYVTNAVKHFKFEPRGKRRIHQTPRYSEVRACRPWLEAELHSIRPRAVVCLGATAARSLLGPQARVLSERGRAIATAWAPVTLVTMHPSAVLRAGTPDQADQYFAWLVEDLGRAWSASLCEPVAPAAS